jgi:hypothetical protein
MHRPIAALVGPEAGHGDDAVVGLADRAEVLAGHMRGRRAVLAVAGVVNHQHPSLVRGGGWIRAHQLHPPVVDGLVIPGRLRQKPLQPLDFTMLGTGDRLGPGQPGQRLVAIAGQQQALEIFAEATALGQARPQSIELLGVGLQRARRGRARAAGRHREIGSGGGRTVNRPPKPNRSQQTTARIR